MKKITKLALTGVLALSTFAAAALPTFAAIPADDWNIATETGIQSLPHWDGSDSYYVIPTFSVGSQFNPYISAWEDKDSTPAEYRLYRANYENEAVKLKTLFLENSRMNDPGGDYDFSDADGPYTFTTGFPTGKYYPVGKYKTMSGVSKFERGIAMHIVNTNQQVGIKPSGTSQARAKFSFYSSTKSDHTGKTGTVKLLSPSGTVIQNTTFTLGANQLSQNSNHTMFQSQEFLTTSLTGYLSGTYKVEYSYYAGGTTFVDSASIVVVSGTVTDVYENN